MIFDFTIAKSVDNLREYYSKLYKLHADAHGQEYMLVHDEIMERTKECSSYTELGVNQGATLAAALLQNPKKVRAYDIALKPYNFAKHLFEQHAKENNIDYAVFENDTLKCQLDPVDVLYIDTKHQYNHLTKELSLHGNSARKYIIFHDTFTYKGLKQAVDEYVKTNTIWTIVNECKKGVGFTTIKKKI